MVRPYISGSSLIPLQEEFIPGSRGKREKKVATAQPRLQMGKNLHCASCRTPDKYVGGEKARLVQCGQCHGAQH